jgi:hypothetical protein
MKMESLKILFQCMLLIHLARSSAVAMQKGLNADRNKIRILKDFGMGDPLEELAKDNFQLLFNQPKISGEGKSFFDFPEAKLVSDKAVEQNQKVISSFVQSKQVFNNAFSNRKGSQKKGVRSRRLKTVKLDKEIEELIPNFSKDLAFLKPHQDKKRILDDSNRLVVTRKNENKAKQESKDSSLFQNIDSGSHSLRAFEKFNKDFSNHTKVSNRSLISKYEEKLSEAKMRAERNHQLFLQFATKNYMDIKEKNWKSDKRTYSKAQKDASKETELSIKKGIKGVIKLLNKYYQLKNKQIEALRLKELQKQLEQMQDTYNNAFTSDQKEVNALVNRTEDKRLDKWKNAEDDQKFISNSLIETL